MCDHLRLSAEERAHVYRVYHGTNGTHTEFSDAYKGTAHGTAPVNMAGFSFTDSRDVAGTFGRRVIEAAVTIHKPYVIDAKGKSYSEVKHVINRHLERVTDHDGLIVKNYADAGLLGDDYIVSNHYVPFSASQIQILSSARKRGRAERNNDAR